jgi:hypothetical protein
VKVPLGGATNVLQVVGRDLRGNIYTNATDEITITFTGSIPTAKDWVVINEIMYHAATNNAEYIELFNRHPSYAFDLSGYRLQGVNFTFPPGAFIQPNGFAVIVKDSAAFASAYGVTNRIVGEYSGSLQNAGETLTLLKPGATIVDDVIIDEARYGNSYPWPAIADGFGPSLQLIDATQDNWRPGNWGATTATDPNRATPGRANANRTSLEAYPAIWINEVLANNQKGIMDGAGEHDPWIELYNSGADPIDLSLYYLSNDPANPALWQFPSGTIVGGGGYLLIWADGQPQQASDTELHTNFRLDPTNGVVALSRLQAALPANVDYVYYNTPAPDQSFGGTLDGTAQTPHVLFVPTPAGSNRPASLDAPVTINEWMASNGNVIADPADGRFDDWFELYNSGTTAVDLGNYSLSDDATAPAMFRIPAGYSIPAHGFLLVWADGEVVENNPAHADLHAGFKLSKSGDSIAFFTPNGALLDTVTFGAQNDNASSGRFPDGSVQIYNFNRPSPRAANIAPSSITPRFTQVTFDGVQLTFGWSTTVGHSYRIESTDDLAQPNWSPVGNDIVAAGTTTSTNAAVAPGANRFFRAVRLN